MENKPYTIQVNEKPRRKVKSKSTSALPSTKSNRSKKENYKDSAKYRVFSKSSILTDVKNTAVSGISNVKQRFNSFSMLLKQSGKSKSDSSDYSTIDNMPTPVKLYSPFTIESPPPLKPEEKLKLREQLFTSPTNCLKQDVEGLECGFNELNLLTKKIENSYKNTNISRSIFDEQLLMD